MPAKPFREPGGQPEQSSGRLTTASKGQKVVEQEERGDLEETEAPVYWWPTLGGLVWFKSEGPTDCQISEGS